MATSIVILRRRRSTLDVSCCVLFANRIVRAASSGDKWDVLKMDGSPAGNIDFEVENFIKFSGSKENSQENVDFEATQCENWKKSRTKCSF